MSIGYIDMHCDTLGSLSKTGAPLRNNDKMLDLERMKKAGCEAQFFAMFVPIGRVDHPMHRLFAMLDCFRREIEKNSDLIAFAGNAADFEKNRAEGKMSAFLTVEDSGIFGGGCDALRIMHSLGVRLVTLTWNFINSVGHPQGKDTNHLGLTEHGIEFIKECENLGVIVDVSHLSDAGFWDVVKNSTKPFVASHSNSRAIAAVNRNLTDEMVKAMADKGGVAGLNFADAFVAPYTGDMYIPKEDLSCTSDDLARHAVHMINVGGEDCVGLGSDYDGIKGTPAGMEKVEGIGLLFDALKKAGLTERVIEKIMFHNTMRVIREVCK